MATCWRQYIDDNGDQKAANAGNSYTPCGNGTKDAGGFSPCCGDQDECYEDNICRFTRPDSDGLKTGYYLAYCTDKTGQDGACLNTCGKYSLHLPRIKTMKDICADYQISSCQRRLHRYHLQ